MVRAQAKLLVVCVNNEGYRASLEKRKIYIALRDAGAEKHGLLRIVDESGEDYLYSKDLISFDRLAPIRQEGRAGRGVSVLRGRVASLNDFVGAEDAGTPGRRAAEERDEVEAPDYSMTSSASN
jgi:hypothetical protein